MELNEQISGLKTFVVDQINAKINEATEAIKSGNTAHADEVKSQLTDVINQHVKRIDDVDAAVQKIKANGGSAGQALVTAAQHIAEALRNEKADAYAAYKAAKSGKFEIEMSRKTVGTMTFGTSTSGQVVDNVYLPGIVSDVYRVNRVRGMLPIGTMSGDKVQYVAQTGGEGNAGTTTEGDTKNQIDQDIALTDAPARKVTAFQVVSEEMLEDIAALSSFIGYTLINKVADAEDNLLLYGANNTAPNLLGLTVNAQDSTDLSGFTVTEANKWDAVMAAKAHLASLNYTATVVAMNPVDLYAMAAAKGSNGQYVAPIFWTDGVPTLWGQPVYMTTAINAGNLLVMDGTRATQLFQRAPLSIRFYDQDSTNARQNLITVVGEERLALPIFYQDAIFYDSFSDILAAIEVS